MYALQFLDKTCMYGQYYLSGVLSIPFSNIQKEER
jgi:hypothetical protein